jgi:glycosyltransferase involved in cell wall biosynthesis
MGRGAEGVHISSIVNAFRRKGHEVLVLSPPGINPMIDAGNSPLDKSEIKVSGINLLWKFISKKVPQVFFEFFEIFYNFVAIYQIIKLHKKYSFDFIYERNAYFLFASAFISKKYKIPLAVEANEVVGIERARALKMKRVAQFIEKYSFLRAESIFTVSSYLKEMILKVVPDHMKVFVTPNAIDPEKYSVKTKREKIREKYGLTNKIVFGFAGWFDWWDRLDITIDIQSMLIKKGYLNTATLLVGDGPPMESLKKRVTELMIQEHVFFTGAVEKKDVLDFIDSFDIGLFSHSNAFGSPVVLFEMMALKKCIIAPSLKPFSDVLTHGEHCLLFPILDKNILLSHIESVITDIVKIREYGNRAFYHVMTNHTWEKNTNTILTSIE